MSKTKLIKKALQYASHKLPMHQKIPTKNVSQKEIDKAFEEIMPTQQGESAKPKYFNINEWWENPDITKVDDMQDLKNKYKDYVSDHFSYPYPYEMDFINDTEKQFLNKGYDIDEMLRRQEIIKQKNPNAISYRVNEEPEASGLSHKIFDQYANAMNRKRSYLYYGLLDRLNDTPYGFREGESFLFGYPDRKIFVPSHFAPSTLKEGVSLIKKVGNSNTPVIFSVTPDLEKMLQKTGLFTKLGEHPNIFAGEVVNKSIMANKITSLEDLIEYAKNSEGDFYGLNISDIEDLLKQYNISTYKGSDGKHYFSKDMETTFGQLYDKYIKGYYNKHKNGGKLIPKQQYGGTSPTLFLYDQAKKTMSDEYKANKQAYDLYLQQGYKNPMSFQDFIKSQNKYIGEINQDTKNKKNLVDDILHYGEYGDSGNGPSIANFLENTPQGIALQFTPTGFVAGAIMRLADKNGVRKTINDIQNEKYNDAALSGLGDAIEVGFGVPVIKKLIKQGLVRELHTNPELMTKILPKPVSLSLAIDDAVKNGTTYTKDGTMLFTNPTMEGGNVLRRVTSPQEAEYTSRIGTWVDPQILRNNGLKIFDGEKRNWKEYSLKNP